MVVAKKGKTPAKPVGKRTPGQQPAKSPVARPKPVPAPPRAPGEKRYWLVKTEPEVFSYADLAKAPGATTCWDGVRNYQARNYLRDQMKAGDGVLIYHSNADPMAIVGVAEIAREGYPDPTQFDPRNVHYDPAAKPGNSPWFVVDIKAVSPLARPLPLAELRTLPGLEKMVLLQKGSRLSVQPVGEAEWRIITRLA